MSRFLTFLFFSSLCSSVSLAESLPIIVAHESGQAVVIESDNEKAINLQVCEYQADGEKGQHCTRLASSDISLQSFTEALKDVIHNPETYGIPDITQSRNLPFYAGALSTNVLVLFARKFARPSTFENLLTSPSTIRKLNRYVPPVFALAAVFALYKTGQFYMQSMTEERASSALYQNIHAVTQLKPFQVSENQFTDIVRRLKEVF